MGIQDIPITLKKNVEQQGHIKVATQIINDLSSGIYSSPATCIKELINNSFDADAKRVTVRIQPIHDSIIIVDDGSGMDALEFDRQFAWISKSFKREKGEYSTGGRPFIGKIGIGFIAVNEICEVLEVTSSKKGQNIKFHASINFKEFENSNTEVEIEEDGEKTKGIIKGGFNLINTDEEISEHYTIIQLKGLKNTVKDLLNDKQYFDRINAQKTKPSFKNMKELLEHHNNKNIRTFDKDTSYVRFIIDLASYIPVEYIDGGPIEGVSDRIIDSIVEMHKKFDFKVDLDGIFLKKPVFFPRVRDKKMGHNSFKANLNVPDSKDKIKLKGYFYTQDKLLLPRELNGLSIKVKNVAIAPQYGYETSFMGYPNYMDQLFRNWISGEIYIEEGLEPAMNIDRQSFRLTHPHYVVLKEYVHTLLREQIFPSLVEPIYKKGKLLREKKSEDIRIKKLEKLLETNSIAIEYTDNSNKHVIIKYSKTKTVIYIDGNILKKFRKGEKNLIESFLVLLEFSVNQKRNINDILDFFYEKVKAFSEL